MQDTDDGEAAHETLVEDLLSEFGGAFFRLDVDDVVVWAECDEGEARAMLLQMLSAGKGLNEILDDQRAQLEARLEAEDAMDR